METLMINRSLFAIILLFLALNIHAMDFKVGLWSKENCRQLDPVCLPQALYPIEEYSMQEPPLNSGRRLIIQKEDYTARILWTKKEDNGGYYSFQIELYNHEGTLITQCARYESLDSFESAPVGSCSGTDPNLQKIVGITVYLP